MSRPRVVLLRGAGLSTSEMSYFAPLLADFDLVAVGTTAPAYAREVPVPVVTPEWPDEGIWRRVLPDGKQHSVFNWALRRVAGVRYSLPGLEKILAGASIVHALEIRPGFTHQAARLRDRLGFKLVTSVSENIPCPDAALPASRARVRRVVEACDRLVALTESARAGLILEGADPLRLRVIPHGIDETAFSPAPSHATPVDILFVARFSPEKGAADLLAAVALLERDGRRVSVAMIGDGPEKEHLVALAAAWNLGVSFVPWIPREQLFDWYRRAQVVVIPSVALPGLREQFSFAALEAMGCGRAIVATEIGSLPEVIGPAGVLIPAGNPRAMAGAIASLLDDGAKRALLGASARKRLLDRFTRDASARAWGDLYREVL